MEKTLILNKISKHDLAEIIVLSQDIKILIIEAMRSYGGSFVRSLAECLLHADPNNTRKIVKAFPEYIIEYIPKEYKE